MTYDSTDSFFAFLLMLRFFVIAFFLLACAAVGNAQTGNSPAKNTAALKATEKALKSSPAYAEILLRRTELEAALEDLLVRFTEDYPKIKETRYESALLEKELNRLLTVKPEEASKLSQALGKLIVRKAELETDLWALQQRYSDEHEDVKRAKRKVAAFEKAIREILPL
jgi:hypothetical protein